MHRAAYAAAGLDWTYDAVDVPASSLAAVVGRLGDDVRGVSVTAPVKPEAAALAEQRTDVVARLGVANTLVRSGSGWRADNTDVPGSLAALSEAGVVDVQTVRLLGAGATAVALAHALAEAGATSIEVVVRDPSRARDVLAAGAASGADVRVALLSEPAGAAADLLVSTIPVAAVADRAAEWAASASAAFDVVYDPWPTALAEAASALGRPVVSGLDLLAHQAVLQLHQMADVDVSPDLLRTAARTALAAR